MLSKVLSLSFVINKTNRTIDSCKNKSQLIVAEKYLIKLIDCLANKRWSKCFLDNAYYANKEYTKNWRTAKNHYYQKIQEKKKDLGIYDTTFHR